MHGKPGGRMHGLGLRPGSLSLCGVDAPFDRSEPPLPVEIRPNWPACRKTIVRVPISRSEASAG